MQNAGSKRLVYPVIVALFLVAALAVSSKAFGSPWVIGRLLLCSAMATIIHLLGIGLIGAVSGGRIERIGLFFGPPLLSTTINTVEVKIGGIPTGGYVAFEGMDLDVPREHSRYRQLPLFSRLLVSVGGPLALVAVSCLLLGGDRGWSSFTSGFPQIILGSIAPLTTGQKLLSQYFALLRGANFFVLGLMMAKMAAFNLLPVPTLNGGAFLLELFGSRLSAGQIQKCLATGLIFLLILSAGWMIAFMTFVWNAMTR